MSKELIEFVSWFVNDPKDSDRVKNIVNEYKEWVNSFNSAQRENSNVSDNVESQEFCTCTTNKNWISADEEGEHRYCATCELPLPVQNE